MHTFLTAVCVPTRKTTFVTRMDLAPVLIADPSRFLLENGITLRCLFVSIKLAMTTGKYHYSSMMYKLFSKLTSASEKTLSSTSVAYTFLPSLVEAIPRGQPLKQFTPISETSSCGEALLLRTLVDRQATLAAPAAPVTPAAPAAPAVPAVALHPRVRTSGMQWWLQEVCYCFSYSDGFMLFSRCSWNMTFTFRWIMTLVLDDDVFTSKVLLVLHTIHLDS